MFTKCCNIPIPKRPTVSCTALLYTDLWHSSSVPLSALLSFLEMPEVVIQNLPTRDGLGHHLKELKDQGGKSQMCFPVSSLEKSNFPLKTTLNGATPKLL